MPTIPRRPVDGVATIHACTDKAGRHILYVVSAELGAGIGLMSAQDAGCARPARRMVGPDWSTPETIEGEGPGLIVWGRHKGDRPSLSSAIALDPVAARAVAADCATRGLAYEDPIVFAEVRRRLGMSGEELGVALGFSPDNPDPVRRRKNAGRNIRRYEAEGAPPTVALALRWLALRGGIIELDG
ncbi:hypothetical protein [Zavarzinia aquatilis]|uniref:Uncharacterized protein n=1 Tax=Zavarzinia aquatilis TaxID=2211142 RepID=A0A317EGS2_9PROT|nr:hypothetical protein [Zavarzinia aquatilis]PWR24593.1 hypothetical protein DKG74_07245 [Zavarzinia aquatilis]